MVFDSPNKLSTAGSDFSEDLEHLMLCRQLLDLLIRLAHTFSLVGSQKDNHWISALKAFIKCERPSQTPSKNGTIWMYF